MEKPNLDTALIKIGIRIWSKKVIQNYKFNVDIEDTLIRALYEAKKDGRLMSLLFSWAEIYSDYVITEKFQKVLKKYEDVLGDNHIINAFCAYALHLGHHKFKKLATPLVKKIFLTHELEAAVKASGAIPWLEKINIIHPNSHFEIRPDSIVPLKILIKENLQLKNRLLYGANWRADIITSIQEGIGNPSKIKDHIGCSYEPANRIYKEYMLATGSEKSKV